MPQQLYLSLPEDSGVYIFRDSNGGTLYIGKAINLKKRVKSYFFPPTPLSQKVSKIDYIRVACEFEAILLEAALVKKHQPRYNVRLKDDKSFLYIAITNEEFPKVKTSRKNDILNPLFLFGPFPSAKTVRQVLRILRKIFPYCSQKGNKRPCFWSHLQLCRPCPGEITKLEGRQKKEKKKLYLASIKNLVSVLKGKSKNLIKNLEVKMKQAARKEDFERATILRDQIQRLNWLTSSHFSISLYLENPNFWEEEQEKELKSLKNYLSSQIKIGPSLRRIEGYDISSISGHYSTGSMVVFQNGVESKDDYRRFKIKISGKPNDTAMLSEVLKRRLGHKEWEYPDLIIVDGGEGQVSSLLDVLEKANLKIPVVGLAKREEEIIWKMENARPPASSLAGEVGRGKWKMERLKEGFPALNLLKRVRDEAHRFAKAYHLKLRKFKFIL